MNLKQISPRQVPMIFVAILFGFGILLSNHLQISSTVILLLLFSCVTSIAFLPKNILGPNARSVLIIPLLISTGFTHHQNQSTQRQDLFLEALIDNHKHRYQAEVYRVSETERYINLHLILTDLIHNGKSKLTLNQDALVKMKKSKTTITFTPGTQINVEINLKSLLNLKNPNGYQEYLKASGKNYLGYSDPSNICLAEIQRYSYWKIFRYKVRNKISLLIEKNFKTPQTHSIIKALIIGDKRDLDPDLKNDFINSGTMHILAVSGLHVGIIAYILFLLSGFIFRYVPKYTKFKIPLIIIGLILFAELSGGATPVWRAVLMTSIYLTGRNLSFESHSLNLLGLTALILILINTQTIFDISFQLSFTAVAGIILIYPILNMFYSPIKKIIKYPIGLLYMGISAQIVLLPLSIFYFHQYSISSPITSIFSIVSATVLISGGILQLGLGWVNEPISNFIENTLDLTIQILMWVTRQASEIPYSRLQDIHIDGIQTFILTSAILLFAYSFYEIGFVSVKWAFIFLVCHGFYGIGQRINEQVILHPHTSLFEDHSSKISSRFLNSNCQRSSVLYSLQETKIVPESDKYEHAIKDRVSAILNLSN